MKISVTTRICIVIVFIALIAFWIVVGAGVYTNGYEAITTRYVKVDGAPLKKGGAVELYEKAPEFELTGAGFKNADWGDYEIIIAFNPAAEVEYTTAETCQSLSNVEVTQYFAIERSGQSFRITGETSPAKIVKAIAGENAVISKIKEGAAPFVMKVKDGKDKVYAYLLAYTCEPTGMIVEPDYVIAG